jgi:purine nucleosidase
VRAHPHEVTIYAAGPMTNIALAISIDPEFAALTKGIVLMGGSLNPQTDDPEFATSPRHEFNFWFDPEAAHIVLRADWPRVDVTTVDVSIKAPFTEDADEISKSQTPRPSTLPHGARTATTCGTSWPRARGLTRR